MWKAISKTVVALIVFAATFFAWNSAKSPKVPVACQEPIAYTIGVFDRRFGLSHKDFLKALSEAETLWEKPITKELFVYAPEKSELAINLIYDSRQEVTKTLSSLGNVVAENETTYKALKKKYDSLKIDYERVKNVYDTRVVALDERNTLYQKEIETWNAGKRTSPEQFDRLEGEKLALEKEVAELKSLEAELNQIVGEINPLVGALNHLAGLLNLKVKAYNTIGASRGESFTGGVYQSVEEKRAIDIYEFSSWEKLVRVLAHELGHALGLEHGDDPKAMMYRLNKGDAGILTNADIRALRALCGVQ